MHHLIRNKLPGGQPVAQIIPLNNRAIIAGPFRMHDSILPGPGMHILQVSLHSAIVILQHIHGAILNVILPWHHTDCRSPGGPTSASRLPGGTVGYITAPLNLRITHIPDPLLIKIPCIVIVQHCIAGNLAIARITGPFPVRTITGKSAMHIIDLTATPYLIDFIKQLVGGLISS